MEIKHLQVGSTAPNINLLNTQGETTPIAAFWEHGPTLLTFLRHFGCIHCRAWLAQLESNIEAFRNTGLQVVAVGQGETKHAQRYCGKLAPSITCLTDETTEPYHSYGLRQATLLEFAQNSGAVLKASLRAMMQGHIQGQATGDVRMLQGTFIIDQQGIIQFTHYNKHAADHPEITRLIEAAHTLRQMPTLTS